LKFLAEVNKQRMQDLPTKSLTNHRTDRRGEMKKIRNYTIVCPSCSGAGYIDNPVRVSSFATIVCPACQGNKTVLVTESED